MSYNPDYDIDIPVDSEAVLECDNCGNVHHRAPSKGSIPGHGRRKCVDCDELTSHSIGTRPMLPEEAAAELCRRHIEGMGVVANTARQSTKVLVFVTDSGANLGNVENDYDFSVHEVGPIEAYNQHVKALATDDSEVFISAYVDGVVDDPRGFALPTHRSKPDGAEPIAARHLSYEALRVGEMAEIPSATENQ